MIVLTKSTTPVQFNISSSTGYNYTGTTTASAATFVIIPSSLQVRESNYTYRHLGLHVTTCWIYINSYTTFNLFSSSMS